MNQPIAIQSWCYRHFKTLPEVLAQLKATGVSAMEICGVHANFKDPATAAGVLEQCKKAGVSMVAMGVERFTGDVAKDRPIMQWAKAAGIKNISITFAPEAMFDGLRNIEKLADEFDLKLGIHNHGGYDWLGCETIINYILSKTSPRIGLHMDTAWAIDASADPVKLAEQCGPRLFGVHVKDFIYDRQKHSQDVVIGTGILDLPKFMSTLKKIEFSGPMVIEFEGDEKNPVPALSECVKKLQGLM